MAEPPEPRRAPPWPDALAAELRALGTRLDVPPAAAQAAAVRQRLRAQPGPAALNVRARYLRARYVRARWRPPVPRWRARTRYSRWRAAVIVALAIIALAVAIPQSRAVIARVLRIDGVELRQAPGPSPAARPSLPGQQGMSLGQARQRVDFPILVPARLGPPAAVTVSDHGRVATLIYDRTPYRQVRLDEFDGHLDQVIFQKFVRPGSFTEVSLNGTRGLWVSGPQEIVYVRGDGMIVEASARLATGSTLIWGTPRVALRLEGGFSEAAAVAIAASARLPPGWAAGNLRPGRGVHRSEAVHTEAGPCTSKQSNGKGATGMPRRFIAVTLLAAGTAIAVTAAVAAPALAKGATRATITGPGLARPLVISADGEALPGQGDALSSLAEQTGLFLVLFGGGGAIPGQPSPLLTPPAAGSLGPKYALAYTVPGVTPAPGQADGQVRQYLYPRAAGGPVIYTPPGQRGFDQRLQSTGWLRGVPSLAATVTRLGVPAGPALPSAPRQPAAIPAVTAAAAPAAAAQPRDTAAPAWLIAAIAGGAAIAIAVPAWWLRRRSRLATGRRVTAGPL